MSNLKTQLQELLYGLWDLGQAEAQLLIYLSHIVAPLLAEDRRIPLLSEMISRANELLDKQTLSPQQLEELITSGQVAISVEPGYLEADQALRLFFEFHALQKLMRQISETQLLHLTNNVLPPGPVAERLEFLQKVQEVFQGWPLDTLQRYHAALSGTPLHMERQVLLQLEPHLSWEILHLVIDLLKMAPEELLSFHAWLTKTPPEQLVMLLQLLQVEATQLLSLKRKIAPALLLAAAGGHSTQATAMNVSVGGGGGSLSGNANAHYLHPQHPHGKAALSKSSEALAAMLSGPSGLTPPGSPGGVGAGDMDMDISALLGVPSGVLHIETPAFGLPEPPLPPVPQIPLLGAATPMSLSTSTAGRAGFVGHTTTPVMIAPAPPTQTIAPSAMVSGATGHHHGNMGGSHGAVAGMSPVDIAPLQLRVARQPPSRTVYQRILKPFPAVMLVGGNPTAPTTGGPAPNNLFVECALVRSDADVELPTCLEGNRIERVAPGSFATFKKLKILSTSQQQGTLFRLRFVLKRYGGAAFESLPGSAVFSQPIEVFSHTLYLTERGSTGGLSTSSGGVGGAGPAGPGTGPTMVGSVSSGGLGGAHPPPPPAVIEVLPVAGPASGGTRTVILGSNFVQSPALRVKFGTVEVGATFHESGTLIAATPPCSAASGGPITVPVRVANDGVHFCETQATFTFT